MWKALRQLGAVGIVDLGTGTAFESSVNVTMFVVRPRHYDTDIRRPTLHERWASEGVPFRVIPPRQQTPTEKKGETP